MPTPPASSTSPPDPPPSESAAGPDPIRWLRVVGRWEAVSFLVLLVVAMPLKYAAGRPEAVSVVGMLHGVLWVAFVAVWLWGVRRLPPRWSLLALVASVVPAGPFWIDAKLATFEEESTGDAGHRHG